MPGPSSAAAGTPGSPRPRQGHRGASGGSTRILLASCLLTISTAGLSNRWTLTLPMIPLLALHCLHRLILRCPENQPPRPSRFGPGLSGTLTLLSLLCIGVGGALTVLFPALELPPVKGPYSVGAIDFYIPLPTAIPLPSNADAADRETCAVAATERYLPARLLYPTLPVRTIFGGAIPYLNPATALEFCRHCMRFGAPAPLKEYGWILHTWRLSTLPVILDAPLPPGADLFPLVVYSHGLGGTLDLYSYQTMALAAHGSIVLTMTHTDGTAPVVPQPRGMAAIVHDHAVPALHRRGLADAYVFARRQQAERRVEEFVGATEFLHRAAALHDDDGGDESPSELRQVARRIRPLLLRLALNQTTFVGHSFGGATVLTAAHRRPELVQSVIAYDPAIDWAPDDCRRSMFSEERLEGLTLDYDGGTGGFGEKEPPEQSCTIHDLDILFLYSSDWAEKDWGRAALVDEMHRHGRLGRKNGVSRHGVVDNATHNEFSDTCMLTPLWLARPVGLAGPRNPIDTAMDIADRTRSFLDEARRR